MMVRHGFLTAEVADATLAEHWPGSVQRTGFVQTIAGARFAHVDVSSART